MDLQIMPLADHVELNNYCFTSTILRIVRVKNNNSSLIIGLKHKTKKFYCR